MLYNLAGSLNSILILLSLWGVYCQLATVLNRNQIVAIARKTESLSLNQFSVSFFAYLAFFIFGYSVEVFNHYLVWPRLLGALLVLAILWQLHKDRRTTPTLGMLIVASLAMLVALAGLIWTATYAATLIEQAKTVSTILLLVVSVMIAQGYWHQARIIIKSGATGAINIRMSQYILAMDCSTILLVIAMDISQGWPLLILALTSASTKLLIIYLFYCVKRSPLAKQRRLAYQG